MFQKINSINQLVQDGAELDLKDDTGNTALSISVMEPNCLKTVKELVQHGANINIINKNGDSIIGLASDCNNNIETKYLLKQGAKVLYVEIPWLEKRLNAKIIDLIASSEQIVNVDKWNQE